MVKFLTSGFEPLTEKYQRSCLIPYPMQPSYQDAGDGEEKERKGKNYMYWHGRHFLRCFICETSIPSFSGLLIVHFSLKCDPDLIPKSTMFLPGAQGPTVV